MNAIVTSCHPRPIAMRTFLNPHVNMDKSGSHGSMDHGIRPAAALCPAPLQHPACIRA
jgi:hypothetical protein